MKEFNWEGFRSKEFAVHCDTEEKAREFIKEAYSRGIKWRALDVKETHWDYARENTCYYGASGLHYGHIDNCGIKIIEWRNNDMKNFREVIRDIKEGEVWESKNRTISMDCDGITIKNKTGFKTKSNFFDKDAEYILKQQSVTFEEVLNSDKRCRVEHIFEDGMKFSCEYDQFDIIMNSITVSCSIYHMKEIIKNGKWYLEP